MAALASPRLPQNPSAMSKNDARQFVIKGGSFLCTRHYCARFRASSRYPQEADLAASHIGFRTIAEDQ